MERLKIVVLAAGTSSERDVSIVTGTRVCAALRRRGHKVRVIDVFLGLDKKYDDINDIFNDEAAPDDVERELKAITPDVPRLLRERRGRNESFFGPQVLEACKAADIVFMGLHGSNGEDGKIQGAFDLLGIKYTGTGCLSSALSMNKSIAKLVMSSYGVPVPRGLTFSINRAVYSGRQEAIRKAEEDIVTKVKIPCVIKPCCGGSSVGVSIVTDRNGLYKALEDAFSLEDEVIAEEYIKGREFSVGIINNHALPVIEIAPLQGFYDYNNKYIPGMTKDTCPAEVSYEISDKMQKYALLAAKALGLETYGRADCLLSEDGNIYFLEMNTLPGMTDTSLVPQEALAEGISYDELCERLVEASLNKYQAGANY